MSEATMKTGIIRFLLAALLMAGSASAETLSDPTRPPTLKGGPVAAMAPAPLDVSSWHLDTVVISSGGRFAVVNGKSLRVGEKISGAMIVDIQPYFVKLKDGGRLIELRLSGGGFAVPIEK